jgi:hypothetical protein
MEHIRSPSPIPDQRAWLIFTGFPPLSSALIGKILVLPSCQKGCPRRIYNGTTILRRVGICHRTNLQVPEVLNLQQYRCDKLTSHIDTLLIVSDLYCSCGVSLLWLFSACRPTAHLWMHVMTDGSSVTALECIPGIDLGTCVTFMPLLRGGRVVEIATAF